MSERLTAWEGHNVDGTPRAVIAKRDGLFPDLLQPILKKLAEYEDAEAHPDHTFWTTQHEALRNIPAADAREVVKAKWEDVHIDRPEIADLEVASMFCPNCHRWHNEVHHYGNPIEFANYCQFCGADMREES